MTQGRFRTKIYCLLWLCLLLLLFIFFVSVCVFIMFFLRASSAPRTIGVCVCCCAQVLCAPLRHYSLWALLITPQSCYQSGALIDLPFFLRTRQCVVFVFSFPCQSPVVLSSASKFARRQNYQLSCQRGAAGNWNWD